MIKMAICDIKCNESLLCLFVGLVIIYQYYYKIIINIINKIRNIIPVIFHYKIKQLSI